MRSKKIEMLALLLSLILVCPGGHSAYYFAAGGVSIPAVQFISVGTMVVSATVTPISVVSPACNVGDLLICTLINKELNTVISAPDGTWTPISQANGDCTTAADDHRHAIFWKTATASGASFSFSKAADNNVLFAGVISVWRGQHATVPIDATAVGTTPTAGANDNIAFPAFDPTATNAHVVYVGFYGNDLTTFAAAMSADTNPDCTKRFDLEDAAGTDCSIGCISGDSDGSNIASRTWATASTTDAGSVGIVFGLVPAP
jgi:hypothetical protein